MHIVFPWDCSDVMWFSIVTSNRELSLTPIIFMAPRSFETLLPEDMLSVWQWLGLSHSPAPQPLTNPALASTGKENWARNSGCHHIVQGRSPLTLWGYVRFHWHVLVFTDMFLFKLSCKGKERKWAKCFSAWNTLRNSTKPHFQ